MKGIALATLLAAALALPGSGGAQPTAAAGLSDRIDAIFNSIGGQSQPGAAVVVIRDGQVIHSRAYGMANVALGVPNTTRTKWPASAVVTLSGVREYRLVRLP